MFARILSEHTSLPDIWGEGLIFAFSGLDGTTNAASGFVATAHNVNYDLLIHTPRRRILELRLSVPGTVRVATGDVLAVQTPNDWLVLAWTQWHTLLGTLPAGVSVALRFEDGQPITTEEGITAAHDPAGGDVVMLQQSPGRFVLSFGRSEQEARIRCTTATSLSIWEEAARRLEPYRHLPNPQSDEHERLLKKCFSVMKVNTLSAEGAIAQTWSTPDRVPHRDMWLWDSVFHSLAMNHVDADVSWELLKSVLATQKPDGMIPHQTSAAGRSSSISQPPLLAWGVWRNWLQTRDDHALAWALPRLEAHLEWARAHRDRNRNGLLEWFIEGDPRCRSGESGLDNSPRFDAAVELDAVDFSTFAAQDMLCVSRIAQQLGQRRAAARWKARADDLRDKVHALLWDEGDGFYYDRDMSGQFSRVPAATGFLPLLLDAMPPGRVDRLIGHLMDEKMFCTAFPVPSLALSHPAFGTDMWRGPAWINLNYLIIHGLRRQGRSAEARWLADRTIHHVNKYYHRYGVIFEFYDATDRIPPTRCDRKGPNLGLYDIRRKYDSIRDYHWSAALTACLLWEPPDAV